METETIPVATANEFANWLFENLICGCGIPNECMKRLYVALNAIDKRQKEGFENSTSVEAACGLLYDEPGTEEMGFWFLYMLDSHDLIEHGYNIRGCWLTEKGEVLLAALEKYGTDTNKYYEAGGAQ